METNAETNFWLATIALCLMVIAIYFLYRMTRDAQAVQLEPKRLRAGFTALPFATQ